MRRKLPLLAVFLAVVLWPAGAQAYLPSGFVGISPQSAPTKSEFVLMRQAGIDSLRWPLLWDNVEPVNPALVPPDWDGMDRLVGLAAEENLRVFPVVALTPPWVSPEVEDLPVETIGQKRAWTRFLRAAVERYGPDGSFWDAHPDLPFLPFHRWEIWNEENIVTFANEPSPEKFARLIRISGRTLHNADPESKVIIGGLFGRPLQIPPNLASGDFLNRIYEAGNVKPFFDGVGLHPYVADARTMGVQLANLRRIMRRHGDPRTPLYVTELGWGSDQGPTRWQRGAFGQARELNKAFALLSANRVRWGVGGAWWFTWADEPGTCIFCTSSGLLTRSGEAKPSWYRFNEWSGGNPSGVPRARISTIEARASIEGE
jgi:hypothetical protein